MADIINLRRERKRRTRAQSERQASENRAKFGEPGRIKAQRRAEDARAERVLELSRISREENQADE